MIKIILILNLFFMSCSTHESNDMADNEIVEVNFYQSICQGEAAQWCYQIKPKGTKDWTFFYDEIEGLKYEWGYRYEVRIKKEKIENPPQDGSSEKWIAEKIIKKTPVKVGEKFSLMIEKSLINLDFKNRKANVLGKTFPINKTLTIKDLKELVELKFEYSNNRNFEIIAIN